MSVIDRAGPFTLLGILLGSIIDLAVIDLPVGLYRFGRRAVRAPGVARRRRERDRQRLSNAIYHSNRKRYGDTPRFKLACASELRANGFEIPLKWVEEGY